MVIADNFRTLQKYRTELADELSGILDFWINNTIDKQNGGFFGTVTNDNMPGLDSVKGVVLNSRILWTFSAAYVRYREQSYLEMASRAYSYIVDHFIDRKYGGVYWSVDCKGVLADGKKQIYGLA